MPTVSKVNRPWLKSSSGKSGNTPAWKVQQAQESPAQKEKRLADTRFYRTKEWAKVRLLHLQNEPLCRHCKEKNRFTPATMVDHIKPIKDGGERLDTDNFQSLCNRCHAKKRSDEGRYYQSKKINEAHI